MAIDPDMQPIIDDLQAQIDALSGMTNGGDMNLIHSQARFNELLNAAIKATTTPDQAKVIFDSLSTALGG